MAKKKIPNMTRAEHKRALERAVGLQMAAMREANGHIFLPKLSRQDNGQDADIYTQVVETGNQLIENYRERSDLIKLPLKQSQVISYYSRNDVQQAIFRYAKGRKISVLRNFHAMFQGSQLRKPEDLLPIMMFYSQEPRLWPSIHGTISRHSSDGITVCDLVIEVDFKKSRIRSFNISRPIVRLFQNLGIEFRIKFSGNASPHIIIPAEALPHKWCRIGPCRGLYGKVLDYLRKQIKEPKTLDGSFRNPDHFLRMPYSLNENTGLVSAPITIEDYDRFSWEMARPDTVAVMEDWWSVPEDAPERAQALIDLVLGQRAVFAVPTPQSKTESLAPQMPDILSEPIRLGIIKAGEEIAARSALLMQDPLAKEAVHKISMALDGNQQNAKRLQIQTAKEYNINTQDMQLIWQWHSKANAIAYYSRPDVQETIYSYTRGRCIHLEGTDEFLVLNKPSDVSAFAAYMVGGGADPVFQCTNVRYDQDSGNMTACDMAVQVEQELAPSVALLLSGFQVPSFALYSGNTPMRIVIPFEVLGAKFSLSKLSELARVFDRYLRRMLKASDGIHISLYEGCIPVPYSIAYNCQNIHLPVRLENVYKLSSSASLAASVDEIEGIASFTSFMSTDAAENAAIFFKDIVL